MSNRGVKQSIVMGLFLFMGIMSAQAVPIDLDFARVTNNNTEDLSAQLSVSIYDAADANSTFGTTLGAGQFMFAISNNVGIASNIAEFYIQDDLGLFSFSSVINSLGGFTDFSGPGASPANLPGGNTIGFNATAGLSVDVNPGPPNRGINTNLDILGVVYDSSFLTADIVNAISVQDLMVGMHIRSIGALGGSDSYANRLPLPPVGIAEPSMLALIGLGLGFVGFARRRQGLA